MIDEGACHAEEDVVSLSFSFFKSKRDECKRTATKVEDEAREPLLPAPN